MTGATLSLPLYCRGKVRDVYDLGAHLLVVATDRISAFDVVLPTPVPDRGKVLTQLSAFWFERTRHLVPNHLVTTDFGAIVQATGLKPAQAGWLRGRSMLVRRARRVDFECVVRGYLAGSAWKEYQKTGSVCGVQLPTGLEQGARLAEPLFTPATKSATGHDENVTFEAMAAVVGGELAGRLRETSVRLYNYMAEHVEGRGLLLADTKFEFGLVGDELLLIDEVGTPDSSRYWDREAYRRGELEAFDKQLLRDYLERVGWDKSPPAPELPEQLVEELRTRYLEAFRRITGREVEL
ncbi:MAG: phosphoribosylaminoimidazolesuccinocarboxamide synthase [Armatimonadota bacterium]|nr:phosphoribosylaminoimidazolesuccinocarboxamide synthase [Armatimonadota bacterium]MDW8155549.1 phosphoribosylaminoimidazolesuccinocarboxamide synthase [Armatimonadota bacterium]